jgi:acyl-CoA synthetase (AMP-forming)/AMP-acid ligase II
MTDPNPAIQPHDEFMVRHSGGTTGRPKGLLVTHSVWLNCVRNVIAGYVPLHPGDVAYHFAPITHASGTLFFMAYFRGATNFMARSFNVEAMVQKLRAGQITNVFLPPTALRSLVQHPDIRTIDPAPLKGLLIGGSVTPPELALTAYDIFGGKLYQLYGASEGGPVTSIGPEEWFAKIEGSNPVASAGRPLPWVEVQIRDVETDAILPIGEIGEIVCRCEARAAGFLDVEDEARIFLEDGWARTSDIGRLDRNGYLYIVDRKDDMIISGGYNIWPAEIETVLSGHPAIIEAGAFAVPHEHWGQTPHAVCVVAANASVTEQELIQLCSRELGSYKKPSRVEFTTETLPKTAVGKIDRRTLRSRWTPPAHV